MKPMPLMTALFAAATALASVSVFAQAQPQKPDESVAAQGQAPRTEGRKVYHAGGPRHDQWAHQASLQARERGQQMQEPKVHPGGRHDQASHEAALRAERTVEDTAKK